jgi:hypothetical protein
MAKLLYAALMAFAVAGSGAAQETDARAIVEHAIAAQGGRDKLDLAAASFHKVKGAFHHDRWAFVGESFVDGPNRERFNLRGDGSGSGSSSEGFSEGIRTMVVEDNKGWYSWNGAIIDFDQKTQANMKKAAYADKVSSLVALVRDPGYTLSPLGESQVKGSKTIGVKVRFQGMPEISLYFDKTSMLLLKTSYKMTDVESQKEYSREVYYSRYEVYDPASEPIKFLRAAEQATDEPALVEFLRKRVPSSKEREQIDLHILELGQSNYSAREKASAALRQLGPKAVGPLRAAMQCPDREVVRRAEQLLERITKGGEPALTQAAVRVLGARGQRKAAEILFAYLPSACDEAVAKEVQFALVALVERDSKTRLYAESRLEDPVPAIRAAAAAVLGRDGKTFLNQPWRRIVVDGLHMARAVQVFRDGRLDFEMETFETEFYNRFDDALFARPQE